VASPPAAAPAAALPPPPAPQTQAAVPSRADTAAASARLGFAGDSADLPAEARAQLRGVIDQLRRGQDARLRIEGFASGEDANRARRLSLSRALAVRAFLMDEGLSSTRMDVYARGGQAEGGPSDRVDLTVFRR
jgi:outer membrane protein OmpA-like peptidoglycan-associated protein